MAEAWQSAWVEVLPDFKNFKKNANREMSTVLGNAGTSGGALAGKNVGGGILGGIKGMGGLVVGAVAALGIGTLVGNAIGSGIRYALDSVDLASDLEQSTGAVLAVFKDQTAIIEGFGKNAAKDVGLARTEYQTFAVVVGAQLKNLGIPVGRISGQTNDLIKLGADLAAQFGGPTSEAVAALSSLLRGERDPIERYGVGIKQADINARLAAQGLSKLEGEAKKQAEIQATLAILWAQTADAQGTFAAEGDTLAGQQQRLQATLQDTQTKLGEALLPAFSELAGFANETLAPALDGMIDKIGPILGQALKDAAPLIAEMADELTPLVEDLLIAGTDALPEFVAGLKNAVEDLPEVIQFFRDIGTGAKAVEDFLNTVSDPEKNGSKAVNEFLFGDARDARVKWLEDLVNDTSGMSQQLADNNQEAAAGAAKSLADRVEREAADAKSSLYSVMRDQGAFAAQGFADGIASKASVAALRAREMARGARDVLRQELKIQSPSRALFEDGANTGEGYALGIESKFNRANAAMRSLVSLPDVPSLRSAVSLPRSLSLTPVSPAQSGVMAGESKQYNQTINVEPGPSPSEIIQIARNDFNELLRSA